MNISSCQDGKVWWETSRKNEQRIKPLQDRQLMQTQPSKQKQQQQKKDKENEVERFQ